MNREIFLEFFFQIWFRIAFSKDFIYNHSNKYFYNKNFAFHLLNPNFHFLYYCFKFTINKCQFFYFLNLFLNLNIFTLISLILFSKFTANFKAKFYLLQSMNDFLSQFSNL
jgi:hypothetical protein